MNEAHCDKYGYWVSFIKQDMNRFIRKSFVGPFTPENCYSGKKNPILLLNMCKFTHFCILHHFVQVYVI